MVIVLSGVTAFGALAAQAGARSAARQKAEMRFTTEKADHSSGLRLSIDYRNPSDRQAQPPAVRQVVEKLARGGRFDTSVPELCPASDAELMAEGADACPDGSRVGTGVITFDTGFPEPGRFVVVDVVFLNNTDELIFLSTPRSTGSRVVVRAPMDRRAIHGSAPLLPGTPPNGASIDTVEARLDRIARRGRSYITTPRECPAERSWTNKIIFTYADGVTQKVKTRNRCG